MGKKTEIDGLIERKAKKKDIPEYHFKKEVNICKIRYKKRLAYVTSAMINRIAALNHIDTSGMKYLGPLVDKREYMKLSCFNYQGVPLPTNSFEWRCKFLSLYMMGTVVNLEQIVNHIVDSLYVSPEDIWEAREAMLCKIYEDMKEIIRVIITRQPRSEILKESNVFTIYAAKKGNHAKYEKRILEVMDLIVQEKEDTDPRIIINDLVLLAYAISTENFNFEKLEILEDMTKKNIDDDYSNILRGLGKSVRKQWKKKSPPIMVVAFRNSRPLIESDYKRRNKDINLNLGIVLMSYLKWLIDDPYISEIIDHVLVKNDRIR